MDRRLQGRVNAADVDQETYLARGQFPQYIADSQLPFFLWLRPEVGQKLEDLHRSTWGRRCATPGRRSRCTAGRCRR